MIFRALIAIGIVSLLTPHEPDLGLGRPGAGAMQPSPHASLPDSASGLSRNPACGIPACAGALGLASTFGLRPPEGRTFDDVKAELEADLKARGYD
jgi:hypothetical protein